MTENRYQGLYEAYDPQELLFDNLILTTSELAKLMKVSTKTVQRLVKDGQIPKHKVGGANRYYLFEVLEWFKKE